MKYVLYCRKSSESEDRQILSLDAQERELRATADKLGLEISAIYHESMSAKASGRPIFGNILKLIQQGKVEGIICWKLDRLARNFVDGGQIIDLLQRGVLKSIWTYEREYLPNDNVLLMAVELGMANQFVRDLSENIKRGNRQKLMEGGWPRNAPFGYKNNRLEKTIEIDETRAKYVQKIFEYYSTGLYSLGDLAKKLYEEGLRTQSGKKVYKSSLQRILTSLIYCGIIHYNGKNYPAKHKALVSKDIFDKCKEIMETGSRPRRKRHVFPLTGLFTCGVCGCSVTAERQKGFVYYHCTNGKGLCDQKKLFLREEKLEDQFTEIFDSLIFDEEIIEIMYLSALERVKHDDTFNLMAVENVEKQLSTLKEREDRLLDAYLTQSIEKGIYEAKQEEIKADRIALTRKLNEVRHGNKNPYATIERTKDVFLAGIRAKSEYKDAKPLRKREIAFELLSNAILQNKEMAQPQLKSPYDLLARTPKDSDFSTLCTRRDSNPRRLIRSQ